MTADELLEHVRGGTSVERLRDHVNDDDLPALAAGYPTLDWNQRVALIELVQDTLSPHTRPLMNDFLVHSPDVIGSRDRADEARAIALCHVEGDLGNFELYLGDPSLVDAHRGDA